MVPQSYWQSCERKRIIWLVGVYVLKVMMRGRPKDCVSRCKEVFEANSSSCVTLLSLLTSSTLFLAGHQRSRTQTTWMRTPKIAARTSKLPSQATSFIYLIHFSRNTNHAQNNIKVLSFVPPSNLCFLMAFGRLFPCAACLFYIKTTKEDIRTCIPETVTCVQHESFLERRTPRP